MPDVYDEIAGRVLPPEVTEKAYAAASEVILTALEENVQTMRMAGRDIAYVEDVNRALAKATATAIGVAVGIVLLEAARTVDASTGQEESERR